MVTIALFQLWGLEVIFFLCFTIFQFFWNVVNIMETILSPSPSAELNEVMIMKCLSFVSPLSVTPLYLYGLVLKEREWGWVDSVICRVFPEQGFLQFSLLSSIYVNLEPQMKFSWQPHRTYLGDLFARAKQRASMSLPQKLQPCQKQLCYVKFYWERKCPENFPQFSML